MPDAPTIDADRYRAVMGRFVTGVTVVTTLDDAGRHRQPPQPFGTTVNSFTSASASTRRWCSSPSAASGRSTPCSRGPAGSP